MKLTARQVAAATVAALMASIAVWYCYLILTQQIEPVLSTWLLISVAVLLGLVTYLKSEGKERSLVTNIGNAVDVFVGLSVLGCMLVFGKGVRLGFTSFEWGCMAAAGAILGYYLLYRNAKVANLAVNALLFVAYLPLFVRLYEADHLTESVWLWLVLLVTTVINLYNPIRDRDWLAIVYAVRGVVSVVIVLALMARIALR